MKIIKKCLIDCFLFCILLFDAHFTSFLSFFSPISLRIICHCTFLGFLWISTRYNKWHALAFAMILGLIYDSYFVNMLGFALFLFPTIMFIYLKFNDVFLKNIWSYLSSSLLIIFLFEFITFLIAILTGLTEVEFSVFMDLALFPTLLGNLVLYSVLYPVFRKIFI